MKILCAPDSFKESMTAGEAASALAEGVRRVFPEAQCVEVPMADGGEGFTVSLAEALNAELVKVPVVDAFDADARGEIAATKDLAVFEIASAVGIGMVEEKDRRIRQMSSAGVGMLLRAALDRGVSEILIGLGGSGTNDGGAGMLRALGVTFLDAAGNELNGSPEEMENLESVDVSKLDRRVFDVNIRIACDVDNPLIGPKGASAIFGPQKGASEEDVEFLDSVLERLATVSGKEDYIEMEGAGAAGGLGFALVAFLGGKLERGIDVVVDTVELRKHAEGCDFVFTGEGGIDEQTLMGKTPAGVANVAKEFGIPVIAFAGKLGKGADVLLEHGFDAIEPIVQRVSTLEECLRDGKKNLADAAERTCRILKIGANM